MPNYLKGTIKQMTKTKWRFEPKEGSFIEVFKYHDLLSQLVSRDLKLKYRRSFLGYLWSILNPLLVMIVMTIVFSTMFGRNLPNFPIYLLCGRIIFEFINTSTGKALGSITDNAVLLKKTYVSKFMFPLAKITSSMIDFVFSMGALVLVMTFLSIIRGECLFSFYNLLFPIVVIQVYVFSLGLGFLLAELHVFFRDIRYIYNAITVAWLYLSAIFYDASMLKAVPWVQFIVEHLNPAYIYIKQFRDIIWMGRNGLEVIYNTRIFAQNFLVGIAYALAMLAIGVFFFRRKQDKFILYI